MEYRQRSIRQGNIQSQTRPIAPQNLHVAQPPSAGSPQVGMVQHTPIMLRAPMPQGDRPFAKPVKASYRRNLPHLLIEDKPLFVTFVTANRWVLPEVVRDKILDHCLHDHGVKLHMFGAIVMPDHVHIVFQALRDPVGSVYGLTEIMGGIKGASAHSINKLLSRRGTVWQDESYDHVCRCNELPHDAAEYICMNPVRKGLVSHPDEYRWLWREWVEGQHVGNLCLEPSRLI